MEKSIQEFFLNIKDCLRSSSIESSKWTMTDLKFMNTISLVKQEVHQALCDNIDTRRAMFALKDLIGETNVYIQNHKSQRVVLNGPLLKTAAVSVIFLSLHLGCIFGLQYQLLETDILPKFCEYLA